MVKKLEAKARPGEDCSLVELSSRVYYTAAPPQSFARLRSQLIKTRCPK